MDRMTKQGSHLKANRTPFLTVSEETIKKRIQVNHRMVGRMVANIGIELPRLCNDFIFKKLLSETRGFYQKATSKDPEQVVRACGEMHSQCAKEISFDALTRIMSTLVEGFSRVEFSAFKHLLAQVFSWYQRLSGEIKDIETKEREPSLFDKTPSITNSATFMQAEKANDTGRASTFSSPQGPARQLEDSLTPGTGPRGTYPPLSAERNSIGLGHLAEQVDEAEQIRRRIEAGKEAHKALANQT